MHERSRRLSEPLRWGRRDKTIVAILLGCAVLTVVGLGVFGLYGGSASRKDCISVTIASTDGAAQVDACGAQARQVCASSASYRTIGPQLAAACRRAGFPYAPESRK